MPPVKEVYRSHTEETNLDPRSRQDAPAVDSTQTAIETKCEKMKKGNKFNNFDSLNPTSNLRS